MKTATQRLMRSRHDKIIGGVAGGIGQYLAVDPVVVRIIFVVLTLTYGIGPVAYLIMWVIMPLEPETAGTTNHGGSVSGQQGVGISNAGNQAFVAYSAGKRRARFDPMTGQPLDPDQEIPIQNVQREDDATNAQMRRNRILGAALVALGVFFIVRTLLPGLAPLLIPAILIAVGIYILSRP